MKTVCRATTILTLFLCLAACEQDPYSGKQDVGVNPPPREKPRPIPEGAYGLEIADIMIFSEGQKSDYIVKASVPKPGQAVLEFKNLPPGAVYDSAAQKLTWSPDYQAANDPANPLVLTRHYLVEAKLSSSEEPTVAITKQFYLTVHDAPRPASVKSILEINGSEGTPVFHRIDFEDQEYPNGPFEVAIAGLPNDVVVDWPNRKVPGFTLRWSPTFDKILGATQMDYTGNVVIYNPRGKRLEFTVKWTIFNRYSAPLVAGPTDVQQPVDVDFVVMAEDLNGEFTPRWFTTHPGYGQLTISTQAVTGGGSRPKSMGIVSWKNIPADKLGTTVTLQLRACVQSSFCSTHQVRVLPTPATTLEGVKK